MKKEPAQSAFTIEFEREGDGRWIAEIPQLPGVLAYGGTRSEATRNVRAVALRTLADRVEQGKSVASIAPLFT